MWGKKGAILGLGLVLAVSPGLADVSFAATGESKLKTGALTGVVLDAETDAPIASASVILVNTERGAASNSEGRFEIADLPVGSYSVQLSCVGYDPLTRTDVIIRAGRPTNMEARLYMRPIELEGMTVNAGYFAESPQEPTGATEFSAEEVRRAPGSAGDVSRIMFSLPSIAKVNDQVNNLIVRGGSPTENSFYVDNIEIPNINHYPLFGTSGGPISLVNTDFVQDVSFSAGGFPAKYGDRLSSVMDLSFREGNREKRYLQADLNFAGIGLIGEGPLGSGRGSWLFSARRSYLDLIVEAIGTGVVPRYSDYQGKVVFDLSPSQRISVLGIGGKDYINFDRQSSIDEGNVTYGWSDGYEYTAGANWRALWGPKGYSNTSLSFLNTLVRAHYFETATENELVRQHDRDGALQFRNVNFWRPSARHEFEFGLEAKYELDRYDHYASEYTNFFGDTIPALIIDRKLESPRVGAFASYIVRPSERLSATVGARYDYFEYTGHAHVAPRTTLAYRLADRTRLTGAFGIYHQTLPMVLLSQQEQNRELKDPTAYHYVLGIEQMLDQSTRLRLEGYYKWYEHFPMNVDQPQMFIIDEMIYNNYFYYHPNLRDDGRARSYGVEATLQKKLRAGVYGLLSAAWFRSQYEDLTGQWRSRTFDNRVILGAEGGWKPNDRWEFSARWIFAGGAPYTPLDLALSQTINRSAYDQSRVNESRYPAYHSLNVRVDRRFNFTGSNMIVYISVWNAYNRENVAAYYWNEIEKKPDEILQWSMLPIFGIEWEF